MDINDYVNGDASAKGVSALITSAGRLEFSVI